MSLIAELGTQLELRLAWITPIKRNAYCTIWRAQTVEGQLLIIKRYFGTDSRLLRTEADGVRRYHASIAGDPCWLDCSVIRQVDDANALALQYVPGRPLSRLIRRGLAIPTTRNLALTAMKQLGSWLAAQRGSSARPDAVLDPFHGEYLAHCSQRLAQASRWSLVGQRFAASAEDAGQLFTAALGEAPVPSFVHGDLVGANVHVELPRPSVPLRLGLIDFANCLTHSHPLYDLYNLRFAIQAMLLPPRYRQMLLEALLCGYGPLDAGPATHRLFYELHRRRWLMLQLLAHNPWRWLLGWIALERFAAPAPRSGPLPGRML